MAYYYSRRFEVCAKAHLPKLVPHTKLHCTVVQRIGKADQLVFTVVIPAGTYRAFAEETIIVGKPCGFERDAMFSTWRRVCKVAYKEFEKCGVEDCDLCKRMDGYKPSTIIRSAIVEGVDFKDGQDIAPVVLAKVVAMTAEAEAAAARTPTQSGQVLVAAAAAALQSAQRLAAAPPAYIIPQFAAPVPPHSPGYSTSTASVPTRFATALQGAP